MSKVSGSSMVTTMARSVFSSSGSASWSLLILLGAEVCSGWQPSVVGRVAVAVRAACPRVEPCEAPCRRVTPGVDPRFSVLSAPGRCDAPRRTRSEPKPGGAGGSPQRSRPWERIADTTTRGDESGASYFPDELSPCKKLAGPALRESEVVYWPRRGGSMENRRRGLYRRI